MATKKSKTASKKPAVKSVQKRAKPAARTTSKPVAKKAKSPARAAAKVQMISPCLWFDDNGEEAARFYVSIFKQGKILQISRYPATGQEIHHKPAGAVMTVEFVLNGTTFLALNGGPEFKFNEAVSLQVYCDTQKEIDYYWDRLGAGGDPKAQVCGWLKDKYGLSWQIVPYQLNHEMHKDWKSPATTRAFAAMMKMKKLDIAALEAAYRG